MAKCAASRPFGFDPSRMLVKSGVLLLSLVKTSDAAAANWLCVMTLHIRIGPARLTPTRLAPRCLSRKA